MTTSELHSLCVAPIRWRCIGIDLEPLTLGHLETLERLGLTQPKDAAELATAVFVCAVPWRRFEKLVRSRFALRLSLWLWRRTVREWDFEENLRVFSAYIVHAFSGPNTSRPFGAGEAGSSRSAIPTSRYLACFLCQRLNHDPLAVRDYQVRDALWDHACVMEMEGRAVVDEVSELDLFRQSEEAMPPEAELIRIAEEAGKAGR